MVKDVEEFPLSSSFTLLVMVVVFDTVRSTFTIPGQRRAFLGKVPYVARLGFAPKRSVHKRIAAVCPP
jgi:hypothetical protein